MQKKYKEFFKKLVIDIEENFQTVNTDHPNCPECNSKMKFYMQDSSGEFDYGDGYWECSCGFRFYEKDLAEAFKAYSKKKK